MRMTHQKIAWISKNDTKVGRSQEEVEEFRRKQD